MATVEESLALIAAGVARMVEQHDESVQRNVQYRAENLQMREADITRIKAEHAADMRHNAELNEDLTKRLDTALDILTVRMAALESRVSVVAVDPVADASSK